MSGLGSPSRSFGKGDRACSVSLISNSPTNSLIPPKYFITCNLASTVTSILENRNRKNYSLQKNLIMKQYLISRLGALLAFFLLGNLAMAQQASGTRDLDDQIEIFNNVFSANTAAPVPVVSEKALKSFRSSFKNPVGASWYQVGKHFLAKFEGDGKKQKALFNKNGAIIYTISYGVERDLPSELRKQIRENYYDYTISMAIEVNENNRTIWVVRVEDSATMITVRLENGEMEEVQNFKKS